MNESNRIALTHHISRKAKKTMVTINKGWTLLISDYTKKDIELMTSLGFSVFSSTGKFECESIPAGNLVINLAI